MSNDIFIFLGGFVACVVALPWYLWVIAERNELRRQRDLYKRLYLEEQARHHTILVNTALNNRGKA